MYVPCVHDAFLHMHDAGTHDAYLRVSMMHVHMMYYEAYIYDIRPLTLMHVCMMYICKVHQFMMQGFFVRNILYMGGAAGVDRGTMRLGCTLIRGVYFYPFGNQP